MPTASNVSVGKPKITGGVYVAPRGTSLPEDATTALNSAFKNMGYISTDGFKKNVERNSNDTTAWGGDVVMSNMASRKETWKTTFIESLNLDVLKVVHGAANVSGSISSGATIKSNSSEFDDSYSVVAEIVMTGNVAKRIVLPEAKITEVGEVSYDDENAIGYETTFLAAPDEAGNASYEYIKSPTTQSTP